MLKSNWLPSLTRRARRRNWGSTSTTRPTSAEQLEPRLLLTTLTTQRVVLADNVSQFAPGAPGTLRFDQFVGSSFDTGTATIGGFVLGTGLQAKLGLHGKVGFDVGASINPGSITASTDFSLTQDFPDEVMIGDVPIVTTLQTSNGAFETQSPSIGGYAEFRAELGGVASLEYRFLGFGDVIGGPFHLPAIRQELFAFNRDNDRQVRLLGKNASQATGTIEIPLTRTPPTALEFEYGPDGGQIDSYKGTLTAVLGEGITIGKRLGEVTAALPHIDLLDNNDSDGLQASGESDLASIKVDAATLIGSAVGIGGLLGTTIVDFGIGNVEITTAKLDLGPELAVTQDVQVTPQTSLTYDFNHEVAVAVNGMTVTDAVGDPNKVTTVSFDPRWDSVVLGFAGQPIEVTPRWDYSLELRNNVDLEVQLTGLLEVGKIEAQLFDFDPLVIGPLYQKSFSATAARYDLFDTTFLIGEHSELMAPFTIGASFRPDAVSLGVTTTEDVPWTAENPQISLRQAILNANLIDSHDTHNDTQNVIDLGGQTFRLTDLVGQTDNLRGDLDVTDRDLKIRNGLIDATGLGERVFEVMAGAGLTLENVEIRNGDATGPGGGIYNKGTVELIDSYVRNNSASGPGGGIYSEGTATLSGSIIVGNSATGDGGGIHNAAGATLTSFDSHVFSSRAREGAAVFNLGTAAFEQGSFEHGSATENGGAISNHGVLDFRNSAIQHNEAEGDGGAIYNAAAGQLTLNAVSIGHNTAGESGGAIRDSSTAAGGGFVSLSNVTFSENTATSGSGGGLMTAGRVELFNSIISGNSSATGASDIDGPATSLGYNLVGDVSDIDDFPTTETGGTNIHAADPKLGFLFHYGGRTPSYPLQFDSPAVGNGAPSGIVDQRGFLFDGAPDIGAAQYTQQLTVNRFDDNIGAQEALSLRTSLNIASAQGGETTIVLGEGVYRVEYEAINGLFAGGNVTVVGAGAELTTIDATVAGTRVLTVRDGGSLELSGVTITGGRANRAGFGFEGGGIRNFGTLLVNDSIIRGNQAMAAGGAIANHGSATIANSAIDDNFAQVGGGVFSTGTLVIDSTTISNNHARGIPGARGNMFGENGGDAHGGGIAVYDGTATIRSSTISNNAVVGGNGGNVFAIDGQNPPTEGEGGAGGLGLGGGIYLKSPGTYVTVSSSTITENSAHAGRGGTGLFGAEVDSGAHGLGSGGGIAESISQLTLTNSVLVGNTADGDGFADLDGLATVTGPNLVGDVRDESDFQPEMLVATANLGPLRDNGGLGLTHVPGPDSPAIDASLISEPLDQRGMLRNVGFASDLGAVESHHLVVTSLHDNTTARTLRQALLDADRIPGHNTIVLPAGVLTLESPLLVTSNVTLQGAGGGMTTIDGSSVEVDLLTADGAVVTLEGLTVRGPDTGRLLSLRNAATVDVVRSELIGGTHGVPSTQASPHGGLILNAQNSVLNITQSTLTAGKAFGNGGAIALQSNTTTNIDSSTIHGNLAQGRGNAIHVEADATLILTQSTIARGTLEDPGDSVVIAADGDVELHNTIIEGSLNGAVDSLGYNLVGNDSAAQGLISTDLKNIDPRLEQLAENGGTTRTVLPAETSPALDAGENPAAENNATDQRQSTRILGGRIDIGATERASLYVTRMADDLNRGSLRRAIQDANQLPGSANIRLAAGTFRLDLSGDDDAGRLGDLDIIGGVSITGAGARLTTIDVTGLGDRVFDVHADGSLGLANLSLSGGTATTGGAVRNAGVLSLSYVEVSGARADSGGAIMNHQSGNAHLLGVLFRSNTSETTGGAVDNQGTLTVRESTFSGNVGSTGSAIANGAAGHVILNGVTVSDNTGESGSLANADGGAFELTNTVIANNAGAHPDVIGHFVGRHNLIRVVGSATGFDNPDDNNILNRDPRLEPLADNGGPTLSYRPQAESPLIDAGLDQFETGLNHETDEILEVRLNPYDQRGLPRDQNRSVASPENVTDIGAVEAQFDLAKTVSANSTVTIQEAEPGWTEIIEADRTVRFINPYRQLLLRPDSDSADTVEHFRLGDLSSFVTSVETTASDVLELLPGGFVQTRDLDVTGRLTGRGTIRTTEPVRIAASGIVSPDTAGTLVLADGVNFGSGVLEITLDSDAAAAGYGRLEVGKSVRLNGTRLELDITPGASALRYTLLDNLSSSPIEGTFANLPDGSQIAVAGTTYVLTYAGGDGNDVVLFDPRVVLEQGTLSVTGTDGNDSVTIRRSGASYKLDALFAGEAVQAFLALSDVSQIHIDVGAGHDEVRIVSSVELPVNLLGGPGNDTLRGSKGNDTLDGGEGSDVLIAGGGNDHVNGGGGNDSLQSGLGHDLITDLSGHTDVSAGDGDDTIVTGSGNDTIDGDAGHDSVSSGGGHDKVRTAAGNDTVDSGSGNDLVRSGGGRDDIRTSGGDDTVYSGSGNDLVATGSHSDRVHSGSGRDTVRGGHGGDLVFGGAGGDSVAGGPGSDTILGQSGADTLRGHQGHDVLIGGNGNDLLVGYTGRDLSIGGAGSDTLVSAEGEDLLIGGPTSHDADVAMLSLVRSEWVSGRSYEHRARNLRNGSGTANRNNAAAFLSAGTTVTDDSAEDALTGGDSLDWFFGSLVASPFGDLFHDRTGDELLDEL